MWRIGKMPMAVECRRLRAAERHGGRGLSRRHRAHSLAQRIRHQRGAGAFKMAALQFDFPA